MSTQPPAARDHLLRFGEPGAVSQAAAPTPIILPNVVRQFEQGVLAPVEFLCRAR
jgi:hypothetical protein